MFYACLLAFCTGFLSLSVEILWIRLFSFTNFSLPQAFAFVLIFYLLGIAFGARMGKYFCQGKYNLYTVSGCILLLATITTIASPLLYAKVAHTSIQIKSAAVLIFFTALCTAILFPIVHHLGATARPNNIGRSISWVYVANIFGATLGPIVVGLFLLGLYTTQQSFILCAVFAFVVAMFCLSKRISASLFVMSTITGLFMLGYLLTFNGNWLIANVAASVSPILQIVENQFGIIVIYKGDTGGDIVAGGNVYDGRTNLDPVNNSNHINRIIIMSALQNKPERVLMMGLSIGSWLKIVTSFPGIKNIDVVEINPGYLQAMQQYPRQLSALSDPRVHLYIDDARRFLKSHPANQYDMVIMNMTYHWRAYATNLLSREFLQLVKQHMRPDAVIAYNATGSPDTFKTATTQFKHVYLYENFVIAADFDWRKKLRTKAAQHTLATLTLDNKLLFPRDSTRVIQAYLRVPVLSLDVIAGRYEALGRPVEIVTDNNLITEYKYGESLPGKRLIIQHYDDDKCLTPW